MPSCSDLFDYTSGRWLYNDTLRHRERRRIFNVPELKRLAASSICQKEEDVLGFEKLAEGGFNRSFLVTMRDNFRFVARIPYPVTQPKPLVIASEVATMDFLRSHGIPVPKVYGYSASADNPAGTEYIFMELIQGQNLGDIWFDLSERQRYKLIAQLVQLESRLFALRFPASGSLYYCSDLPESNRVIIPNSSSLSTNEGRFCIGPDTSLGLWYGRRLNLPVERGPYQDCLAVLTAGAKKEIAYLSKFGQPLQPFQRLRRETYNYQPQSHLDHIATLKQYLQIAPTLIPRGNPALHRPVLRHPDLQPNNIFVSDQLEITGLIDWQHSTALPLFLQCAIPNSLQNYGDDVSESLQEPTLPSNFNKLEAEEQYQQAELFRKRQLHYLYVKFTSETNPDHYNALAYDFSTLRRRLFHCASDPWEGDNATLKSTLITLSRKWADINGGNTPPRPLVFSDIESNEYLKLARAQSEADEQLKTCQDLIGVGNEGWVPVDQYEGAMTRAMALKTHALDAAETAEERARIEENWIFGDFCEGDYM
ncbi:kinase-like protein [Aspergillus heteromorphus CBS 117.55]|uniref:Kinase-like protein n=1 Tax=Aspergillus heteromorphus CBS 117.55 TaxID=1448321 RepID=A0A317WZT8_9EURO|nr:kinase-like protein [Aspergillus heteromorphus CBS 117.55]PWY89730.1 kinase-like protein [Aspergillus heteromorphus CBS 117.55]